MGPSREDVWRVLILLALVLMMYLLLLHPRSHPTEPSPPPNLGTGEDGSPRSERGAQ
jgi:hypothetical protein